MKNKLWKLSQYVWCKNTDLFLKYSIVVDHHILAAPHGKIIMVNFMVHFALHVGLWCTHWVCDGILWREGHWHSTLVDTGWPKHQQSHRLNIAMGVGNPARDTTRLAELIYHPVRIMHTIIWTKNMLETWNIWELFCH